ncbi:MAG: arginine--tRNA ligase [Planctomycetes bacterium]|nr:arginine--tRNA ligase [Planctomycetota bacterium]
MPDPQSALEPLFRAAISKAFGDQHAATDPLIRPAQNDKFGDYQANVAMSLAKAVGAKPRDVATKIIEALDWKNVFAEPPTIAGPGFINIKLDRAFLEQTLAAAAGDERLGVPRAADPQTVVVDYSGPNVAKEMHVGHLRSSVIGDAIARVLDFEGHTVVRQNHLGDWGTQFGMLIEYMASMVNAGDETKINDLNAFYQQAKARFDADPTFAEAARKRVVLLQSGDAYSVGAWTRIVELSKRHFNSAYQPLGVKLSDADIRAESFYNPRLADTVAELEELGLTKVSDGAICVFPPGFAAENGEPLPLIIRKSDGGYLYATTDLAALRFRVRDLHADRIIYVTDSRQKQHFAMVFKTAELAGWTAGVKLEHVPFGSVLGEDGKPFKTRSGETVKLADLLNEAEERALKVVTDKSPELPTEQRQEVAHAVGIGAIKYADLANDRIKDYVFSWERMLSFDGNTAPYLQNAVVRIRSIFRKAATQNIKFDPAAPITLADPAERSLALRILQFPGVVNQVAQSLEPHRLCTYLYELASLYHGFYERCPVLTAPDGATRSSRLALSALTERVLKQGLDLLGIGVVDRM